MDPVHSYESWSVAHEASKARLSGYRNTQIFRGVQLVECAHQRLPLTELANFWLSARLTWIEIKCFNRAALLDFPDFMGTNGSHYDGWSWSPLFYESFLHNVSLLKESLFGPPCITWCCNWRVWPLASMPGALPGGLCTSSRHCSEYQHPVQIM